MNNSNKLVLIGGGGHCKSVIDVAESAGFKIAGILDTKENIGKKILDYSIVGTDNDIINYVDNALFLITVGQIKDASFRIMLHEKVIKAGGRFATVISRTAHVSKYAFVDEGTVVMHNAVVNSEARIGKGCIINTFSNIEHDAIIGDYCHISTGAMVNGNCEVGKGTFLGSQAVMVNGVHITEGCIIAAGTTVRKDILIKGVYADKHSIMRIKL